jgi:hypothetical protein
MKEEIYVEQPVENRVSGMVRRVSWGAIISGLFVTVILQVILTLLGAAIGAASIDPLTEQNPAQGLGTGAAIWLVASGLIALFFGAWVAGRLSGGPRRMDGLLHGVVTFSVAEVSMILLLATGLGNVIGGTGSLVNRAMGTTVGQQWQSQIEKMIPQGGAELPSSSGQNPGITPQQEQQLREAGDKAASGISRGALWAFVGMVLGLLVAAWGGWAGTASLPRYDQRVTVAAGTA